MGGSGEGYNMTRIQYEEHECEKSGNGVYNEMVDMVYAASDDEMLLGKSVVHALRYV